MMKIFGPFRQLITLPDIGLAGPVPDEHVHVITQAGILVKQGRIYSVGNFEDLRKDHPAATHDSMGEGMVVIPGFTDAHTHLCWASDRMLDYSLRVAGKSYLEIAEAGGGIWSSVLKTREASMEELTEKTITRATRHLMEGVTTIEVKSGYGLSVDAELKLMRAIRAADSGSDADLIPTCLAAHMKPRDFDGSERDYLDMLLNDLLPVIREEELAQRVDIFVERTAFNTTDSLYYLQRAAGMGFQLTVHADQFTTGGSMVGLKAGAISVDHLEASGEEEIRAIAGSDVTAVALPGASLGLGMGFTPARSILDAGGRLAIASDWNPGSAPMGDLLMQAAVLGAYEKLTIAETLAGITFRAAGALGLTDRGRLVPGELADFQAYDTSDYRDIFYHQGKLKPEVVWKKGKAVNS